MDNSSPHNITGNLLGVNLIFIQCRRHCECALHIDCLSIFLIEYFLFDSLQIGRFLGTKAGVDPLGICVDFKFIYVELLLRLCRRLELLLD